MTTTTTTRPTSHSASSAPPRPVEELLKYMSLWDHGTAQLPWLDPVLEPEPEPQYLYVTEQMAEAAVLSGWTQFRELLQAVIGRSESEPDRFQYLTLINGDLPSVWCQMTPLGPDAHYVELSDGAGWVDELVPASGERPWSTDQTEAIMRLWVTRRFQRADAQRSSVPRQSSG